VSPTKGGVHTTKKEVKKGSLRLAGESEKTTSLFRDLLLTQTLNQKASSGAKKKEKKKRSPLGKIQFRKRKRLQKKVLNYALLKRLPQKTARKA